jgi:hypothetical protein
MKANKFARLNTPSFIEAQSDGLLECSMSFTRKVLHSSKLVSGDATDDTGRLAHKIPLGSSDSGGTDFENCLKLRDQSCTLVL